MVFDIDFIPWYTPFIIAAVAFAVMIAGYTLSNDAEASSRGTNVAFGAWIGAAICIFAVVSQNMGRTNEGIQETVNEAYMTNISIDQANDLRGGVWFLFGVSPDRLVSGYDEDETERFGRATITMEGEEVEVQLYWDGEQWTLATPAAERGEEPTALPFPG